MLNKYEIILRASEKDFDLFDYACQVLIDSGYSVDFRSVEKTMSGKNVTTKIAIVSWEKECKR